MILPAIPLFYCKSLCYISRMSRFAVCPHCGADLKPNAVGCPECGSDESTGWKSAAMFEHPDVAPFDDDDYRATFAKEFGRRKPPRKAFPWKPFVVGTILFLLVALKFLGVAR